MDGYLPNSAYVDYQTRYAVEPRESDKTLIRLLIDALGGVSAPRILDVGCSTGNLLKHLKGAFPDALLQGGDAAADAVEICALDPELADIEVRFMDVTEISADNLDAVIVNAVLFSLDGDAVGRALSSLCSSLRPGGVFANFEFYHPFPEELEIIERSKLYPDGLTLHSRSIAAYERLLLRHGFTDVAFHPFEIPIDLHDAHEDSSLTSYTRRLDDGTRLIFRGALAQPWCHVIARKA